MSDGSIGEALGGLLGHPVVALVIGWAIGNLSEKWREDRKRYGDVGQRWLDAQKDAVTELQLALVESLHGANNASTAFHFGMARLMEHRLKPGTGKMSDALPDPLEAAWHREWLAAIRKLAVLIPRVADPDLKRLAEACRDQLGKTRPDVEDGFTERFAVLENAVVAANDRAGVVYRELVSADPVSIGKRVAPPEPRSWWQGWRC